MGRLLAQDVLLLCWDDQRGKPRLRCAQALPAGIGGALLLDAVLAEAVTIEDGQASITGRSPDDPLVAEVVEEVRRRRRPPKPKALVSRLGKGRRVRAVRDRMVREGLLRESGHRLLGVIPVTRRSPTDTAEADELRARTRSLLVGASDPEQADDLDVVLASLAGATGALDVLVARRDRKAAKERAEAFRDGTGVSKAVSDAIREAQAAAAAGAAGAAAAGAS